MMQINQFLELTKKRRSIRKFKSDPIPDEYINKILEAARWSPSGANGQPWSFIVVKDKKIRHELGDIFARLRDISLQIEMTRTEEFRQPHFRTQGTEEVDFDIIRERFSPWAEAPVVIVLLGDRRMMQASTLAARMYETHTFDHNMACTSYAIHLAAAACGLGAQWVSILPFAAEEMKLFLGVPSPLTLFNLVPIGYPAHQPSPTRRELKDMVHYDKYDISKFMSMQDVQKYIKASRQGHAKGKTYAVSDRGI